MSKRDQMKVLDEQQLQLQRYEKRLKDVVAAYKSLRKEKEALEATLKAFTDLQTTSEDTKKRNGQDPRSNTQQVGALMKSLSTLTEEKSRSEEKFQADKKAMKKERDELLEMLETQRLEWKATKTKLKEQIDDLKNKLWTQQMDREKEQKDHAVMLRELQTLVAVERSTKEQLECQLEDIQRNFNQPSPIEKKCEEYQGQIQKLSEELEAVGNRMKAAEERAARPEPLLLKIQREMEDLKLHHATAVLQEQRRANDAEEQLQQIAQSSEDRVASLEARLSELSEMVGNYDRARQKDQQAITKLKERVSQLDTENSALMRAASTTHSSKPENRVKGELLNDDEEDYHNLDVHSLLRKMVTLKGYLNKANQRSQYPVDVQALLKREGLWEESEHQMCREEIRQLKEECERYKLRVQSGIKHKNIVRDNDYSKEVETLQGQISHLNKKVRELDRQLEESEKRHRECRERHGEAMALAKHQHGQEFARLETEYRGKVAELDDQLQKQRQRAMALLQEKDDDIRLLKMSLGLFRPDVKLDSRHASGDAHLQDTSDEGDAKLLEHATVAAAVQEEDQQQLKPPALSEELSHLLTGRGEGHLLHYLQEISRKNQEIKMLRKARHQLENTTRELHLTNLAEKERLNEEIEELKAEINRLDRNCSREGANLEYLKNVVYNYLTSSDSKSRQHMLNAIATLLEFSPKELANVKYFNSTWWWQPGTKKPTPAD